jgi:hypothetical protein
MNKNTGNKLKKTEKNDKKASRVINLANNAKQPAGLLSGISQEELIFALDIGTRTVVGVVGAQEESCFRVLATEITEHKNRAMLDGQIHDIEQVAQAAADVKQKLEARLGVKLKKTYNINPLPDGKKAVNDLYFNVIDIEEKAYWLGFMYADGYVGKNNKVELTLQYSDLDHLNKFKKALMSKHKIGKKEILLNNKRFTACRIHIKSTQLATDLIKYGCFNNKGLIIRFPELQSNLISHFIRGYFDGDGCISVGNERHRTRIAADFTSGSLDMLKDLQNIFLKELGVSTVIDKDKRTEHVYRLYFKSKTDSMLFLDYIYDKSNEAIRLNRKFDKYANFKECYGYDCRLKSKPLET